MITFKTSLEKDDFFVSDSGTLHKFHKFSVPDSGIESCPTAGIESLPIWGSNINTMVCCREYVCLCDYRTKDRQIQIILQIALN